MEPYENAADEPDAELQEKYRGDLDTSLVFASLFSAVCSAFIIQIQPELWQDPNDAHAVLRILIYATNSYAILGGNPTLPEWPGSPAEIVTIESMLCASLFVTLLAAFLAALGKQWLARYSSVGVRGPL